MNRSGLIARLEELQKATNANDDTRPASAILSSLIGALLLRSDVELMRIVAAFSSEQIHTIKSRWN